MDYFCGMRERQDLIMSPKSLGTVGMEERFCISNALDNYRTTGNEKVDLGP